MKLTLRLDPPVRNRLENLAHLAERSISASATDLLRVLCPLAPPGTVLVPMDRLMMAAAVEAGLAHQMAPYAMMEVFLQQGKHVGTADPKSPRVQDLLQHLGGDAFGLAIDRMNERRFVRAAAAFTQHALTPVSVTIADDVVDCIKAWGQKTRTRVAAAIRVALQPGRMPFALIPVPVTPAISEAIATAASVHGVSAPMEAALWAWSGIFHYFSVAQRAKGGSSDLARQIQRVTEIHALPHVWRLVVRTTLPHPADAWVFAQWMWYAPFQDAYRIFRRVGKEPIWDDGFLRGLPAGGNRYLYDSMGIDKMVQDVLHPPETDEEEEAAQVHSSGR